MNIRWWMLSSMIFLSSMTALHAGPNVTDTSRSKYAIESRLKNLTDSCSKDIDSRLDAADHLMELIVRRITRLDNDLYIIEKPVWEAGDLLFRLTISFQQNHISRAQCVRGVNAIRRKLFFKL
jgi:hypothetical protein